VAPHVETAITPDADHHLAIVKPEWVNNEVLYFLTNQWDGKGCNDPQNLVG
jgi:hypothetical protein